MPLNSARLLVVSNRLPVTISADAESPGGWKYAMSSGGLVSALSGLKKEMSFTWIGWPGMEAPSEEAQATIAADLLRDYSSVPVFLDDRTADLHYNGFSNSILWPLFHYHPGDLKFVDDAWSAYQQVNMRFAKAVAAVARSGDIIWIQDYHLMLLPRLLRAELPESIRTTIKIGFFLHTPFPSSEIYRVLPVRKEILRGVLASDLVGFHTFDYARHFLSSCSRLLGLQTAPNAVEVGGRMARVGTFPIGIDPDKFTQGLDNPIVQQRIDQIKRKFDGVTLILGVDRLDYIKGVPQKLLAFEVFLTEHPDLVGKVALCQVAIPSRQDVEEYQNLRSVINELVGRINGTFGGIEFTPIHLLHRSVDFVELTAMYAVADVCLVSSTRDGMNLVSYEYVACQRDRHGVLILSEFAGAAQSMNGSLIVNPWNTKELASAIHQAVTMDPKQREGNHEKLYRYVCNNTAADWGMSFVNTLIKIRDDSSASLPKLTTDILNTRFRMSQKIKLILLDYDGTLMAHSRLPDFARPSARVRQLLASLTRLPDTFVFILSGRRRDHLDAWFGDIGVGLVAEHGCFIKHPKSLVGLFDDGTKSLALAGRDAASGWSNLAGTIDPIWKETIRPVLQHYTSRTPGSAIEEKEIITTWHYRNTDPEFGQWQSSELQMNLEKLLSHMPLSIIIADKALELRPAAVDKSTAVRAILRDLAQLYEGEDDTAGVVDFVLCVGDGKTDEPVFSFLNDRPEALTCTVAKVAMTEARYWLEDVDEVAKVLQALHTA